MCRDDDRCYNPIELYYTLLTTMMTSIAEFLTLFALAFYLIIHVLFVELMCGRQKMRYQLIVLFIK